MGARQKIFKSINTMKTLSESAGFPSLSSYSSESLQKKIEKLLTDTTTTSSTDPLNDETHYLIPYTFRVMLPESCTKTNQAKCPPFYMQLDHTIAVLWHVFADKNKERKKNMGIGQLQWALYFLKGIKDPLEGTRQADIDIAIKAIEDNLIESYAGMANLVMKKPRRKYESHESILHASSLPKRVAKIGESASLGIMVMPRRILNKIEDINMSSVSYTTLERNPDISTTLEELIKFRNITQEKKPRYSQKKVEPVLSNSNNENINLQGKDAYEMLKQLRGEQIKKLSVEINHLRKLEEAANVKQSEWHALYQQPLNSYEPFNDN